jgi:hypothetical protein
MDPVTTTIISAFVIGAAQGARKVGDKAVTDCYDALKHSIRSAYAKCTSLLTSIDTLEGKPDSEARRKVLEEEVVAAELIDDPKVVDAADKLLSAAKAAGPQTTVAVDWEDVELARLKIGEIKAQAGAIGFRAARLKVTGQVEITKIGADGGRGNS